MFAKFAEFFIKNSKLTLVLIIVTILSGIGSYLIIPKQYNPTIEAPAFGVNIKSPGFTSDENKRFITQELENKISEIDGIDKIFSTSGDNYVSVMAQFKVGENREVAKTRLSQKLSQNIDLKPIGAENPTIISINPDDLPQITYAISYKENGTLSSIDKQIYLRQIANVIKDKVKTIPNTTTLDIVGGIKKNLIISLDIDKLSSLNIDIGQVYNTLKLHDIKSPNGDFHLESGEKVALETIGKLDTIKDLEKLIISNIDNKPIFLEDIASFSFGEKRLPSYVKYGDKDSLGNEAILFGVGKQVGTNGVFVTNEVKNKIEEIKKTLPSDIKIEIIQDEGLEAQMATGHLIQDLILSIVIVIIILIIFLGWKNALNTATSIPIILSLVFLYSYIVGFDINRISLFALILVIGMLVDDSIVVVENIVRHLEERAENKKTKLEAILEAVQEVGSGVVLSTITKILAFSGMFAVSGMMGEYMGPIPTFAIIALLFSILVAFAINPFVSYFITKDIEEKDAHNRKKQKSKFDLRDFYLKIMKNFIKDDKKGKRNRKIFKITFWVSLLLVIILPVYFGVFKARMLPKSNKDQVYLWVDAPRGTSVEKMVEIEKDIQNFFLSSSSGSFLDTNKNLDIVSSISSSIGTPFIGDFANLFRGGLERFGENQISARINLISKDENKNRIKSEDFVLKIRPILRENILKKYPNLTLRLLEDPPGPPVKATFMVSIQGGDDGIKLDDFTKKIYSEVQKVQKKYDLVDLGNSLSTTYRKIAINLNHESISRAGLNVNQVVNTLGIAKTGASINIIKNSNSFEATNVILTLKSDVGESMQLLDKIFFINPKGDKIPLLSIGEIKYDFVNPEINTDKKEKTNYVYSEVGDNSVVYPIIGLMGILKEKSFLNNDYQVIKSGPYGMEFLGKKDGFTYKVNWAGEWELTMDTFADMGIAMLIAILAIYFLIVAEFSSFGVAGIIMLPFLLGFFGIFPGFSILYLLNNEYFNATAMIGVISLAGIVVGNSILLIDYVQIGKKRGWTIENALLKAGYIRFMPIMLTSIAAILGAIKIVSDPVWSGLAWSIVSGLSVSAILTLIAIPIFYYDSQKKIWDKSMDLLNNKN